MSVKDGVGTTVGAGCGCVIVILGMSMIGLFLAVVAAIMAGAGQM